MKHLLIALSLFACTHTKDINTSNLVEEPLLPAKGELTVERCLIEFNQQQPVYTCEKFIYKKMNPNSYARFSLVSDYISHCIVRFRIIEKESLPIGNTTELGCFNGNDLKVPVFKAVGSSFDFDKKECTSLNFQKNVNKSNLERYVITICEI